MYKLLLFIIIIQLLNVSKLIRFKIYTSFIKNLALLIFIFFKYIFDSTLKVFAYFNKSWFIISYASWFGFAYASAFLWYDNE